ncbi:MAG TPA: protease inhibitor I42 family protein [Candidatus Acidoferrales bacterium]|nr:protease inhibitor I42 family protein [Candidatus Acidoferrales bacterium]
MKRFFIAALAATALAVAPAAASINPHSPVFIASDAASPITVQVGEDFFIAVQSNDSTGYSWTQALPGGDLIVAYEGNVREPADPALAGAPGQQIFIYHANRSGSATIVLNYTRPFEPDAPPAKTLTFTVNVP